MMSELNWSVPSYRIRQLNEHVVRGDGRYVVYWMTAYRRTASNFALQRASDWARELRLPLVVLDAPPLDYQWATERAHALILDGIEDVGRQLAATNAVHFAFVEEKPGAGQGLLEALGRDAALVVSDDAPVPPVPQITRAAAGRLSIPVEVVDHNGLLPMAATDRVFVRAHDLRRFLHRNLRDYVFDLPATYPMGRIPRAPKDLLAELRRQWPSADPSRTLVSGLALDRSAPPAGRRGGETEANRVLSAFVADRLARYTDRNHPDEHAESGLSPYLRSGNISTHQILDAVAKTQEWSMDDLREDRAGSQLGWWGMDPAAEGFLDQVVTWRELGYRAAVRVPDNDRYSALPSWARATLADHADDAREYVYTIEQFEDAATHDDVWNAAQTQLRTKGTIHNYLRMLWGKKILEWTRSPQDAHDTMFDLNNRYALDGRDPNSVSGIHWVLGRYDRAWGPERSVFGKVRYMSSAAARRKLRMNRYLERAEALF